MSGRSQNPRDLRPSVSAIVYEMVVECGDELTPRSQPFSDLVDALYRLAGISGSPLRIKRRIGLKSNTEPLYRWGSVRPVFLTTNANKPEAPHLTARVAPIEHSKCSHNQRFQ
jgi:hypothetical protein